MFPLQEIGVIGAYATAISVVLISVCITVFTTKENPGKEVKEPIGKFTWTFKSYY